MSDFPVTPFETGDSEGVAEHLNLEFAAVGDAVAASDAESAAVNLALHGTGRITGLALSVGSGLGAQLTNGEYLLAGKLYSIDESAGYDVVAMPASSTRYLYMDAGGVITQYATAQTPNPTGTWYVGSAVSDGTTITSVSQAGCDEVASPLAVAAEVEELAEAVGLPYTSVSDLATRVSALETGGSGGGDGGYQYWENMPEAAGVATTPGQAMDTKDAAAMAAHVTALHGAQVAEDTIDPWDVDAVNQSLHLLRDIELVDYRLGDTQEHAITIVPGAYGDGSHGGVDFIDRVNSTWVPT